MFENMVRNLRIHYTNPKTTVLERIINPSSIGRDRGPYHVKSITSVSNVIDLSFLTSVLTAASVVSLALGLFLRRTETSSSSVRSRISPGFASAFLFLGGLSSGGAIPSAIRTAAKYRLRSRVTLERHPQGETRQWVGIWKRTKPVFESFLCCIGLLDVEKRLVLAYWQFIISEHIYVSIGERIHLTGFHEQFPSSIARGYVTEEGWQEFSTKEHELEPVPLSMLI